MNNVGRFFLLGIVCLPAIRSVGADVTKGVLRAEAVVQKYEPAAMEDLFEDGGFVSYDAVMLKIVSPPQLTGKTIRVFFVSETVADNSPIRRAGERCRFDFDANLLKADLIFSGALENLQWKSRVFARTDRSDFAPRRPQPCSARAFQLVRAFDHCPE